MNNNKTYKNALYALMMGTAIYAFPGPVHAQITTTTETSTAALPSSSPSVSSSSSSEICVSPPGGSGDAGGEGGGESSDDSDGDGIGDNDQGVGVSVSGASDGTGPSSGASSGGGGGGGGSKILCTHFYHKNMLPEYVYNADIMYSKIYVKDSVRNGYHAWAIPVVRYLRAHPDGIVEKVAYFLVRHWAQEMAYVMEVSDQRSVLGRAMRLVGEPLCGVIGKFTGAQDWKSLYRSRFVLQS